MVIDEDQSLQEMWNKETSNEKIFRASIQDVVKEALKCILLCANCHREVTNGRF